MSGPPPQPPRPAGPRTPPPPPPKPWRPPPKPKPTKTRAEALLSVAELAQSWGVSRQHVYNLIHRGELATVDLGHGRAYTRISATAASEFIAGRSRQARRAAA